MRNDRSSRRGRLGVTLLLALTVGGCDFINPITSDPNAVPEATVDQLFTGIQVNTFFFASGGISRLASMWMQQMTGTDRQFIALDEYVFTEEDAEDEFVTIYTGGGLVDLKQGIAQAEDAGRRSYAGILKVHQAFMFGMAASHYGDIPYSEAADPEIIEPALDEQAAVYAAVQSLLDDAIADLAAGGTGPGSTDLVFGGDTGAWTAVAHTLKARYHMHWAEVNGQSAYQAALNEAANGISDPADNWTTIHTSAATENNLWHQFMRDRSGYISSGDFLVPAMVAENDPRLPFYYSPSGGTYVARESSLSETGYGAGGFDFPFVTCAENAYIRAEAQYQLGNQPAARTAAKDGLECQEDLWGVDLSAEAADLDAAAGAALLDEIMLQKYTALFLNPEAWNDYKRTCRPAIVPRKAAGVPGRFFYGQAERQSNPNIPEPAQQPVRNDNDPNAC